MQLNIKKIGTSLIGSVLTGATLLGGALAADISDFAKMGPSDTVVVVGASAATSDVVGAINIGAALAQHGATSTSGGAVSTTVDNGVALFDASNALYLGKALNVARDTVTSKDLPNLLAKGTFEDDDATTYDYTQSIVIGSNPTMDFAQTAGSGTDPALNVKLSTTANGQQIYKLKVDFSKTVALNTTASKGNTLTLFGAAFTVGAETTADKLILYKSATDIAVNKDEEVKVTVGDTEYTVFVKGFTTAGTGVILQVGSETKTINEGSSRKVGGLTVYAKTVSSWDSGNQGLATLQVGSEKVTLEAGQSIMTGDSDTTVDGTYVKFNSGTTAGQVGRLSTIEVFVAAKDGDHDDIGIEKEFVDPFTGTIKVSYGSVSSELKGADRDQIKVRTSGDFKGYVTFKDVNGRDGTIYYVRGSEAADSTFRVQDDGDSYGDSQIVLYEGGAATKDDQKDSLFLAPGDSRYTHLVEIKTMYNSSTVGYYEFTDAISGETYKSTTGNTATIGGSVDLNVDGKTYSVTKVSENSLNVTYADNKIVVYPAIKLANGEEMAIVAPLTGLSIANGTTLILPTGEKTLGTTSEYNVVVPASGGRLRYNFVHNGNNFTAINTTVSDYPTLVIVEENDKDTNKGVVNVKVSDGTTSDSKTYVSFSDIAINSSKTVTGISTSNDKVSANMDFFGTYIEKDTSSDKHSIVTVWYPDTQMTSSVYLLSAAATAPVGGGTTGGVRLPSLGSGISKLDTDVGADKTTKNLILVGGPAINTLVAELGTAGKTPTIAEWRTQLQGKAIVQAIGTAFPTGKTAIVVAGYEKAETLAASLKFAQEYSGGATPTLKGTAQQYIGGVWSSLTYPLPAAGNTTA